MYKFIVHPRIVKSINDEDSHNASGDRLADLYGVRKNEYMITNPKGENRSKIGVDTDIHLYPDYSGIYDLTGTVHAQIKNKICPEFRKDILGKVQNLTFRGKIKFLFLGKTFDNCR